MTMLGKEVYVFAGSSHLAQASYDPSSKTLEITFQDGRTYAYQDVSVDTYAGLCNARSAGSYFHQFIEPNGGEEV